MMQHRHALAVPRVGGRPTIQEEGGEFWAYGVRTVEKDVQRRSARCVSKISVQARVQAEVHHSQVPPVSSHVQDVLPEVVPSFHDDPSRY